jgi:hypothetical protein
MLRAFHWGSQKGTCLLLDIVTSGFFAYASKMCFAYQVLGFSDPFSCFCLNGWKSYKIKYSGAWNFHSEIASWENL